MATESFHKTFVIDDNNVDFFIKLLNESHPTVIRGRSFKKATKEEILRIKKYYDAKTK